MPRKASPDLIKSWKVNLPATLAGKVEFILMDPIHQQPRYGTRGFLIEALLEHWLATVTGDTPRPLPTLEEVRDARS